MSDTTAAEHEVDQALLDELDEIDDVIPVKPKEEVKDEEKEKEDEERSGDQESAEKEEDKGESKDEQRDEEVARPSEEREVVEEVVEKEPVVEEKAPEPKPSIEAERLAAIEKQNEELRNMVQELMAGKKGEEKEDTGEKEAKIDKFDFLEGIEIDADIYEPGRFKETLNTVAAKVYKSAVEQTVRRVPDLVESLIGDVLTMRSAVDKFYEKNPDLQAHKAELRQVADFISNENPNLTFDQLLEETGRRFRMYKGIAAPAGRDDSPPVSPKAPGARKPVAKTTTKKNEYKKDKLEEEMDELDLE